MLKTLLITGPNFGVHYELIEINPQFKKLLFFICLLDSQHILQEYLEYDLDFAFEDDHQSLKASDSFNINPE